MFAIIPIRRFDCVTTRLCSVLNHSELRRLALYMAKDVLNAVAAANSITGIAVVTGDYLAVSLAHDVGAEVFPEPEASDLSEIIGHTVNSLRARGVSEVIYLPADIPLITPLSLDKLIRSRIEGVSLVSARRDGGTNALILSASATIPFFFGPDSCARHVLQAAREGIPHRVLRATEFETDIDTPGDFFVLANMTGRNCASKQFARRVFQRRTGLVKAAGWG